MKYYNLMDISFSQLIIFQTAASFKNFTRTAEQLAITQPTVSKSIAGLEEALGVTLFIRSRNHRLELTAAGQILLEYCSQVIPETNQAFNRIQLADSTGTDFLKIGANVDARNDDYLLSIIKKYAAQADPSGQSAEPRIRLMTCTDLFQSVRSGKEDAAILCTRETVSNHMDGLSCDELIRVPVTVYVHASNPLFERDALSVDDIAHEPLILLQNRRGRNTHTDSILNFLVRRNIVPNVGMYVNHAESIGFNLCLGKGIFVADEFFALPYNPDVKAFYLRDFDTSGLSLIYRSDNHSEGLSRFRSVAIRYFQEDYICPFHIYG